MKFQSMMSPPIPQALATQRSPTLSKGNSIVEQKAVLFPLQRVWLLLPRFLESVCTVFMYKGPVFTYFMGFRVLKCKYCFIYQNVNMNYVYAINSKPGQQK